MAMAGLTCRCLGRSGKRDDAIVADQKAIWLGDAKTRLNVYFNLAALEVKLDAPDLAFTADGDPKMVGAAPLSSSWRAISAATAARRLFAGQPPVSTTQNAKITAGAKSVRRSSTPAITAMHR